MYSSLNAFLQRMRCRACASTSRILSTIAVADSSWTYAETLLEHGPFPSHPLARKDDSECAIRCSALLRAALHSSGAALLATVLSTLKANHFALSGPFAVHVTRLHACTPTVCCDTPQICIISILWGDAEHAICKYLAGARFLASLSLGSQWAVHSPYPRSRYAIYMFAIPGTSDSTPARCMLSHIFRPKRMRYCGTSTLLWVPLGSITLPAPGCITYHHHSRGDPVRKPNGKRYYCTNSSYTT